MSAIDADIFNTRALVIDGNPTSRSLLAAQLRDFGVGTVQQTGRVHEARSILELKTFDIILCDYHFDNSEMSGQELLDDLRRAQLLPYSTVFVMVTGEASYARVTEAAENALDGYLLKPYTAVNLGDRLAQARNRKRVLKNIFEAVEAREFARAAALCKARFEQREQYWLYAARIGAELYLRIGDAPSARALYDAVVEERALPWAKLGIARAQIAAGQLVPARRTLDALVAEAPGHADAYDVLGQVQVEQGELEAARETFRSATELTPGSISRMQAAGIASFYAGDGKEALPGLERACLVGVKSRLFDPMVLVLLSLLRFDTRDGKGLAQAQEHLARLAERTPDAGKLQRLVRILSALRLAYDRQHAQALDAARALAADVEAPEFDIDTACALAGVLVRLDGSSLDADATMQVMRKIAERFCVSRASCEMLLASANRHDAFAGVIQESHAAISSLAERAMGHSLNGEPRLAVRLLLDEGERTRNGKLIEMAGLVAQRHREKIEDADDLRAQADTLKLRYGGPGHSLGVRQGGRSAGGLTLRA
jgi:CheY-like chemotaxis protein